MKHVVPTDLINEFLAYMGAKPYSEVSGLIAKFHQLSVPYIEPIVCDVEEVKQVAESVVSDVVSTKNKK